MAVSGSKDFELDVADYVEEAFERCGLELRTGYDLKTANRSLNLMLAEWANRGLNQWTINQKTLAMVKDTTSYTIDAVTPTATIDVLDVFIRETIGGVSTDVPMTRMSRSEYANMSVKSSTGKPNQYFVDKQISPTITVWPAPDQNSKYDIYLNVLSRMDDADAGANTLQIPFRFLSMPSRRFGLLLGHEASAGQGANAQSVVRRRVSASTVARRRQSVI